MLKRPAKTDKKQSGIKFQPGQSGNPKGRPQGSRNKATIALENLLNGEAKKLTQKAIDLALDGDTTALRLCMERICPPRKDRPIEITLPEMKGVEDIVPVMSAVLNAVGQGNISPDEARQLSGIIETFRKAIELADLEERINQLEKRLEK